MVAMCEADATVSDRVVALVRIEGSSSRHGGYDASESWLEEAHIGLIGGRAQKRVWHAQIVNRCGEFGGQAPTVGRIATNTVNTIYIFDKRRIDPAVTRAPSPPIQSNKTFVCVAKEASVDKESRQMLRGVVVEKRPDFVLIMDHTYHQQVADAADYEWAWGSKR